MSKSKKINNGINILRIFMCFVVICCHFYTNVDNSFVSKIIVYYKNYAVCIFMVIAAYYAGYILFDSNVVKLKDKLKKLFFPHLFWSIIYFISFKFIYGFNFLNFKDLLFQIITGHSEKLNPTMWFQIDLILLIIAFYFILLIIKNKKYFYFIALLLFLFSMFLEYSHLNLFLFSNLPYELKYPLGRLIEMIPYFIIGLLLYKTNLLNILSNHWKLFFIIFIFFVIFLYISPILFDIDGFGYSGIKGIFVSIFTIILFYILPLNNFNLENNLIFKYVCKYTMGIYIIHRLIEAFLRIFINSNFVNNLFYCILIYIVSYFICFIISSIKLPKCFCEFNKKLV